MYPESPDRGCAQKRESGPRGAETVPYWGATHRTDP